MRLKAFLVTIMSLFISAQGHAAERTFRVYVSKSITPLVERFYAADGNAFATVFCDERAPQVMIVDSRLQDLDGKTFYFSSLEECNNTRTQAQQLLKKCVVELLIDTSTSQAGSRAHSCRP